MTRSHLTVGNAAGNMSTILQPSRRTSVIFVAAFVSCLAGGCSRRPAVHGPSRVIAVSENNWKHVVLEAKDPVLVDFWASWCGPCREMKPTIEALANEFKVCA